MRTHRSRVARSLLLWLLLPAAPAFAPARGSAAPGDPVASFGTGGFVTTDFAGGNDSAAAITPTLLGRFVVAGSAATPGLGTDFALARYDESGALDPAFGTGGKVTTDFFGEDDGARDVVVQPDQRIVVAGFATNGGERQFAFARYNPDGSPDATFGGDGTVVLDLGSTSEAFGVALQGDRKIVAVGDSRPQASLDFTVVRLDEDGTPDASFGVGGVATIDFGNADRAIDLALDADSLFVAGIVVRSATDSDFGIARLDLLDASLVQDFAGDGKLEIDFFGKQDGAQRIERVFDASHPTHPCILVTGFATDESSDFAVARYDIWGNPDTSFSEDGRQTFDLSGGSDLGFDSFQQPDGRFVTAGWAGVGASFDLGLVRFESDGALDENFGVEGVYTLDTADGGNNVAFDAVIAGAGMITAGVGLNPETGDDDFVVTAHENEKFAELVKRAPAEPVVRGDFITYTFEVTNLTDDELSLIVTDRLPEGASFEESQNTGWSDMGFNFGPTIIERQLLVPGGQTVFFGLRVRADQSGLFENKANLLLPHPADPVWGYVTPTFLGSSTVESQVKPEIAEVTQVRKKLIVTGEFEAGEPGAGQPAALEARSTRARNRCPTILVDGRDKKTKPDRENPTTVLVAKKGARGIARGETVGVRVRLCSGAETEEFLYTRPQ